MFPFPVHSKTPSRTNARSSGCLSSHSTGQNTQEAKDYGKHWNNLKREKFLQENDRGEAPTPNRLPPNSSVPNIAASIDQVKVDFSFSLLCSCILVLFAKIIEKVMSSIFHLISYI